MKYRARLVRRVDASRRPRLLAAIAIWLVSTTLATNSGAQAAPPDVSGAADPAAKPTPPKKRTTRPSTPPRPKTKPKTKPTPKPKKKPVRKPVSPPAPPPTVPEEPEAPLEPPPIAPATPPPPPPSIVSPPPPSAVSAKTTTGARLGIGLGYRASLFPQAFLNLFATGGQNLVFHTLSLVGDVRVRRWTIVPAISYSIYQSGDMLLGDSHGTLVGYFADVKSNLSAVSVGADLLYTIPLNPTADLELGGGLGLGVVFGSLVDNWVFESPSGSLAFGDRRFSACTTVSQGVGCRPQDHATPRPVRVNGYLDKPGAASSRVPFVLPGLTLPEIGFALRPSESMSVRVGLGLSITGVWLGLSGLYDVGLRSGQVR